MQDTVRTEKRAGGALRLFMIGVLTIVAALLVNLVVRALAFATWPISPGFLPLQIGAISGFTIVLVGGVCWSMRWWRVSPNSQPARTP